MKRGHFAALRPVCPVCLHNGQGTHFLNVAFVSREEADNIIEGILHCSRRECQREYPIFHGIPLLVADIRTYITHQLVPIVSANDFSPEMESLLGDCCGPDSSFESNRQYLSSYAWDHFEDKNPATEERPGFQPGSLIRILNKLFAEVSSDTKGAALDVGCSVGRGSFALAERRDALVLGVDLNFSMLRLAQQALNRGIVSYPLRKVGMVYEPRNFAVSFLNQEKVDFWACDAQALPFVEGTFDFVMGLNVLDCVTSPHTLLQELVRLAKPGQSIALSTPFDWSPRATPVEAWIGGHSQRGLDQGACEPFVKRLLTPGQHPQSLANVSIEAELPNFPWTVRLHGRSFLEYQVYGLVVRKLLEEANSKQVE